jgi:hypothetical protein
MMEESQSCLLNHSLKTSDYMEKELELLQLFANLRKKLLEFNLNLKYKVEDHTLIHHFMELESFKLFSMTLNFMNSGPKKSKSWPIESL